MKLCYLPSVNKVILLFCLLVISTSSYATIPITPPAKKAVDTTKRWTTSGLTSLTFNQLSLTNWAAGGESSVAGKGFLNYNAIYTKGKYYNENNIILAYGLIGFENRKVQKTDDKIDLSSTFSYTAYRNWSYSSLVQLKTQFANGFKYPDDSTVISTLFAPAYLTLSLGMNYSPTKTLGIFLAPISGRMTFVLNQELANQGAYGVRKADTDADGNITRNGSNFLGEVGINLVMKYNEEIFKNIQVNSILTLFNNYLDDDRGNRWNIDVDWETNVNFVVNKYISAILYWHMIYDHDVKISEYQVIDGKKELVKIGPRLQFKESLGISLTYKF